MTEYRMQEGGHSTVSDLSKCLLGWGWHYSDEQDGQEDWGWGEG